MTKLEGVTVYLFKSEADSLGRIEWSLQQTLKREQSFLGASMDIFIFSLKPVLDLLPFTKNNS
jgi:hypothetical protein